MLLALGLATGFAFSANIVVRIMKDAGTYSERRNGLI